MKTPPQDYVAYCRNDGPKEGELSVNPLWYVLWSPEEIEEMNKGYEVAEYAPGFLGFASSGGGEMLAFDKDNKIFSIPFIGMSPKEALPVAKNWEEFVTYMI